MPSNILTNVSNITDIKSGVLTRLSSLSNYCMSSDMHLVEPKHHVVKRSFNKADTFLNKLLNVPWSNISNTTLGKQR